MNINRVLNAIGDPTRINKFEVDIYASSSSSLFGIPPFGGVRLRGVRCIGAQIPGRTITATPFGEQGFGPKRLYPSALDYDSQVITLIFLCDNQFEERRAMEAWQEFIYDKRYGLNYLENYMGKIVIRQLDRDMEPVYTVELNEVYPAVIAPQQLDAASAEFQRLSVTFNYTSWSSEFENVHTGILGGLFNKAKRRLKSKIKKKIERKITNLYY